MKKLPKWLIILILVVASATSLGFFFLIKDIMQDLSVGIVIGLLVFPFFSALLVLFIYGKLQNASLKKKQKFSFRLFIVYILFLLIYIPICYAVGINVLKEMWEDKLFLFIMISPFLMFLIPSYKIKKQKLTNDNNQEEKA